MTEKKKNLEKKKGRKERRNEKKNRKEGTGGRNRSLSLAGLLRKKN